MNGSKETWDQIQKLVDGIYLSNLITEDVDNVSVSVKDERDTEILRLPVRKLNNLWIFISKATELSVDFLHCLNTRLAAFQNEEKPVAAKLSETLSAKIDGLHLKVEIPNSLTEMLQVVINTSDASSLSDVLGKGRHPLSVVLQIPELDTKYMKLDCVGLLQPHQLIPAADPKWYYKVNQFAIKLNFSETIFEGTVNDSQALVALAIILSCYPEQWYQNFFWDAWLAVTIQLCLSADLKQDKMIFPCMWMKHVFDVERLVSPRQVKYILFGQDPLSKTHAYTLNQLCKTTGIAFHAVGNDNPAIQGMKMHYGLDCDGDNPMKYCHDGLLMVNLIRSIGEDDEPLSKNSFRGAWVAYTLKIMHHFSRKDKPVIILTTASSVLPEIYVPIVCNGNYVQAPGPCMPEDIPPHYKQNIDRVCQYLSSYRSNKHKPHTHKPSTVCMIL